MKAVVYGTVSNLLPRFGLAYAEGSTLYLSEIWDNRGHKHLRRWIELQANGLLLTLFTQHKSLREDIAELVREKGELRVEKLEAVMEYEDEGPQVRSLKLLPPLADRARRLYMSLTTDEIPANVRFVCAIGDKATTLTEQCCRTLNIMTDTAASIGGGSAGRAAGCEQLCLLDFLNRCTSPMGKRRLPAILRHPLLDDHEITARVTLVKTLIADRAFKLKLQNICISRLTDLDALGFRLATSSKLSTEAKKSLVRRFGEVVESIDVLGTLVRLLIDQLPRDTSDGEAAGSGEPPSPEASCAIARQLVVVPLQGAVGSLARMRQLIEHVFDLSVLEDARSSQPDVILLNPKLSNAVQGVLTEISDCERQLETHRVKLERDLVGVVKSGQKVKYILHPSLGRILRAPKSVDLPAKYTTVRVNKNELQFTTPTTQSLLERISAAQEKLADTEEAYIDKTLEVAKTYLKPLMIVSDLVGLIDICCGFATAVTLLPSRWVAPVLASDASKACLHIEAGRHALLDVQAGLCAGRPVVPNSLHLQDEGYRLALITGPNMGGKSTFARQAALAVVLAQIGCLVPAERMRFRPFSLIWTRIGAEDSPGKGISTFMTEALESTLMLQSQGARPEALSMHIHWHSLLIVDELGRGTSASDGFGFAAAMTRRLAASHNCISIFATHFHELAEVPEKKEDEVECSIGEAAPATCYERIQKLCISSTAARQAAAGTSQGDTGGQSAPTTDESFRVREGVEADSEGIVLAQKLGFPTKIIEEAGSIVSMRRQQVV